MHEYILDTRYNYKHTPDQTSMTDVRVDQLPARPWSLLHDSQDISVLVPPPSMNICKYLSRHRPRCPWFRHYIPWLVETRARSA